MDSTRIAALLEPFLGSARNEQLATAQLEQISTYIDILLRWNARINLTAVRDAEQIVTRHFGESLFAARHLFPGRELPEILPLRPRVSLADIGSGAGFPGLPIKMWVPHISATLIESNHKKATFLREVVRILTLTDINVTTERAEELSGLAFDVVTLRAVEQFESILRIAVNLVAAGGRLALLIGAAQVPHAQSLLTSATSIGSGLPLGWKWGETFPIPLSKSRLLAIATRLS